ncbi:MAG: hypothetical protein RMK99_15155 [Anaerolineales bacterium]|nr:hypothetical protein [Anaerolineales bacterium]
MPQHAAHTPLSIRLFFVASWLLGGMLTFDGLHQRLWNAYWSPGDLMWWTMVAKAWGLSPLDVGFPFVVAGLSLIGASFGLYLRRNWGWNVGLLVSMLALGYVALGTSLAVLCLALLALPGTRAYLRSES